MQLGLVADDLEAAPIVHNWAHIPERALERRDKTPLLGWRFPLACIQHGAWRAMM